MSSDLRGKLARELKSWAPRAKALGALGKRLPENRLRALAVEYDLPEWYVQMFTEHAIGGATLTLRDLDGGRRDLEIPDLAHLESELKCGRPALFVRRLRRHRRRRRLLRAHRWRVRSAGLPALARSRHR